MKDQATSRPWSTGILEQGTERKIFGDHINHCFVIAKCDELEPLVDGANAQLIVKAVNEYDTTQAQILGMNDIIEKTKN